MTTENLTTFDLRDQQTFYLEPTPTRHVVLFLIHTVIPMLMDVKTTGLHHFPKQGGVILAANHLTNFDVLTMQMVLERPLFFMAKKELFTWYADAFYRHLGAFPVHRGERDVWALNYAKKVLQQGKVLGMFPEGRRSRDATLQRGRRGVARLALDTGTPIVPMALTGTNLAMKNIPQRAPVTIEFAPVIQPTTQHTPESLTHEVMQTIAGMLPEANRGVYA